MEACARSGPFHMMEALKREDPTTSVMKATKMLNVCNKLLEQKENGVRQRGASWQMIEKGVGEVKSLIHRVFLSFSFSFSFPFSFSFSLFLSLFRFLIRILGDRESKARKRQQWGSPSPLLPLWKDKRFSSSG